MADDGIEDRLARLESLVEQQQETIEDQQETIAEQRERLAELESDDTDEEATDSTRPVSRRDAIKAGGLVGLLGLGAGTASADPQGQIGTSNDPLEALYTAELNGPVTGDQTLTDLTGTGLSIDSGTLSASGASSWEEADSDGLLEPKSPFTGIDVADVQTDSLNGGVTGDTDLTDLIGGGLTADSGTLVGTYVQDSEPPIGDAGTLWARTTSFGTSAQTSLSDTVNATAFGDDGSGEQFLYTGDSTSTVSKIDPSDLSAGATFSVSGTYVEALTYGADGFLYVGDSSGVVYKLDPSNMSQQDTFSNNYSIRRLAYGNGFVYASDSEGVVFKIDPSDMSQQNTFSTGTTGGVTLAYGTDGFLYASDTSVTVYKLDPSDMSQQNTFAPDAEVDSLAYGADGYLYAGDLGSTVYKLDSSDMSQQNTFSASGRPVKALAYGTDGALYAGDTDGIVYKLEPSDMSEDARINKSGEANSITYGDDRLVYAGVDSTVFQINPGRFLFVSDGSKWVEMA